MEIELKLALDSKAAQDLRAHPLLQQYQSAPPQDQLTTSVYFDTPKLAIWRCAAGLRVRHCNDRWVQTLKGGGDVAGGLHRRNEWESPVVEPSPDLAALRALVPQDSPWGKLLRRKHLAQRLVPVFSTEVLRTVWQLHLPDGVHIECVLDLGTVRCGAAEVPISEIELELKSGAAKSLFAFALRLQKTVALRPANLSKAARGYALFSPTAKAPSSGPLILTAQTTVEQAFQQIALRCLDTIQSNEDGVLRGDSAESVHAMRVGLRRLRCAFSCFATCIALPPSLGKEWEWLAAQLGTARDWDVLADTTIPALNDRIAAQRDVGVDAVRAAAQRRGAVGHRDAAAAVASTRYCRLQLRFMQWLYQCDWRSDSSTEPMVLSAMTEPIELFAQQVQRTCEKRLRKRGKHLRSGDAAARHRVRIAAKHARYAAEFFQSLHPKRRVRRTIDALTALQDALGRCNDAVVADRLLNELAADAPRRTDLATAVGFLRGYLAAEQAQQGKTVRKLFKRWRRRQLV